MRSATGSIAADAPKASDAKSSARPALTVTTVQPARADLPLRCVNAPEKLRKLANLYGVDTLIFDDL